MSTEPQEQRIIANFLVHHFLRIQRILGALASSQLILISGGDLFFELNKIYIRAHEEFFRILEIQKDNKDFDDLARTVDEHGFSHYKTLEAFSDWHDMWLLPDHMKDDIDPITGEITRIAVKYNIRRDTYYGMDVTSSLEESLINTGTMLEELENQGLSDEAYKEAVQGRTSWIWSRTAKSVLSSIRWTASHRWCAIPIRSAMSRCKAAWRITPRWLAHAPPVSVCSIWPVCRCTTCRRNINAWSDSLPPNKIWLCHS